MAQLTEQANSLLHKRQKLIKLADSCEAGWEYESLDTRSVHWIIGCSWYLYLCSFFILLRFSFPSIRCFLSFRFGSTRLTNQLGGSVLLVPIRNLEKYFIWPKATMAMTIVILMVMVIAMAIVMSILMKVENRDRDGYGDGDGDGEW